MAVVGVAAVGVAIVGVAVVGVAVVGVAVVGAAGRHSNRPLKCAHWEKQWERPRFWLRFRIR